MRAEIERLRHVVCTRCPDEAQAEIERLRAQVAKYEAFWAKLPQLKDYLSALDGKEG